MVPFLALLLALHIIEVFVLCGRVVSSIHARRVQCCWRVWDNVNSLVLQRRLYSRHGLILCLSCVLALC